MKLSTGSRYMRKIALVLTATIIAAVFGLAGWHAGAQGTSEDVKQPKSHRPLNLDVRVNGGDLLESVLAQHGRGVSSARQEAQRWQNGLDAGIAKLRQAH